MFGLFRFLALQLATAWQLPEIKMQPNSPNLWNHLKFEKMFFGYKVSGMMNLFSAAVDHFSP